MCSSDLTSQFAAQIAVMEQAMVAMNTEKAASEQAVTQVQGTIEEVSKQREPIASKRTVSQSQKEKLIATKNQLTESKGLVADVAPIDAAIVLIDSTVALRDGELANLDADLKKYDQQMAEMTTQLDNAKKALAAVGEKLQAHQGMVAMQKQQLEKSVESSNTIANDCSSLREKVSLDCESVFALPPERALSPEQFAWSLLTATNVLNGYRDNQKSELDKNSPLPADANAEQIQARELQIVRGACDKLQGSVDGIANLFSSGIGKTMDDFFASPDQALYVANGGSVYSWAAPSGTNVTQRVVQSQDLAAGTTLLMRGLLSRSPTPQEMQWITEAIGSKPESKGPVVHELVWGILASVEFRLYP